VDYLQTYRNKHGCDGCACVDVKRGQDGVSSREGERRERGADVACRQREERARNIKWQSADSLEQVSLHFIWHHPTL